MLCLNPIFYVVNSGSSRPRACILSDGQSLASSFLTDFSHADQLWRFCKPHLQIPLPRAQPNLLDVLKWDPWLFPISLLNWVLGYDILHRFPRTNILGTYYSGCLLETLRTNVFLSAFICFSDSGICLNRFNKFPEKHSMLLFFIVDMRSRLRRGDRSGSIDWYNLSGKWVGNKSQ